MDVYIHVLYWAGELSLVYRLLRDLREGTHCYATKAPHHKNLLLLLTEELLYSLFQHILGQYSPLGSVGERRDDFCRNPNR